MGALPESQVVAFLERLTKGKIGGEEQDLLKTADAALVDGNAAAAADIYAQLLQQDCGNVHALAGLARCYVETGNIEQAKKTLAMVPEAKQNEAPVAAARAALEVAEQAKSVGPLDELEAKVAANPLDHQARFDLATALNAAGKRAEAVEQLLDDRQEGPQMERGRARASSWCSSSRPGALPIRRRSKAASGCRRFCFRELSFRVAPKCNPESS